MKTFLSLLTVTVSCFYACAGPETSKMDALPFTCGPESASQIYFEESHRAYLKPFVSNSGAIRELIVFGGSFSDTGILGSKTMDAAVPNCTYWNHRVSNGPVWNDYIAGGFDLQHKSYAVGGATANPPSGIKALLAGLLTPFPGQIAAWEKDYDGHALDKTLFVVWLGPNDYLYGAKDVQDKDGNLKTAEADELVRKTIAGIESGVARLQQRGATHIVLGNIAHVADVAGGGSDPVKPATYDYLERRHNALLEELPAKIPGVHVFHAYERNEEVFANLSDFGFDNNSERCYSGSLAGFSPFGKKTFCATPLRTRHWDDIHPNTRMHCHWADQFLQDVGSRFGLMTHSSLRDACVAMRTKTGRE